MGPGVRRDDRLETRSSRSDSCISSKIPLQQCASITIYRGGSALPSPQLSADRGEEGAFGGFEVAAARRLDSLRVPGEQGLDVVEVFADRDRVAGLLVHLVPLIMVVEHERDHAMEV